MRKTLLVAVSLLLIISTNAQQQSFDLMTFTPPAGWKKEVKQNLVTFTKTDDASQTWCVIGVVKSTASKGNIDADLLNEWNELVVKQYQADSMQLTETSEAEGWKIKAASGQFYFNDKIAAAILTTFSGFDRCISILATTNSQAYLETVTEFVGTVELKKPEILTSESSRQNGQQITKPSSGSLGGFRYTTTTFDNGWTAREEADWVKLSKGDIVVLLHYAKEGTTNSADPEPHINTAWNILVAPRYSNLKNYKIASPSLDHQRAYLGAGDLTDNDTQKQVYVALFRKGSSNWIEIIGPDKASFVSAFGLDINQISWDSGSEIWQPLLQLFSYNKFAIDAADLTGKWASWSGSNVQYVNAYTGLDAGMGHAQSGNEIVFKENGTYDREYKGVSGSPGMGNTYYGEKNSGKAIISNWEIKLTNAFKGETHAFTAQFEAVKGGRILHLYRGNIEEMHMIKIK